MIIDTLIFDTDNTLVFFDERAFFKGYFAAVTHFFSEWLDPELFRERLMSASKKVWENNGELSNIDCFFKHLITDDVMTRNDAEQRFNTFYSMHFESFRKWVKPLEGIPELFKNLRKNGYRLISASNPLWPEKIQRLRLEWAGLNPDDFEWITHIENSRYCKPNPQFFMTLCRDIHADPEKCIMIGNDPLNDMAASMACMKTFLTTDAEDGHLAVSRKLGMINDNIKYRIDFKGSILDLPDIISKSFDQKLL